MGNINNNGNQKFRHIRQAYTHRIGDALNIANKNLRVKKVLSDGSSGMANVYLVEGVDELTKNNVEYVVKQALSPALFRNTVTPADYARLKEEHKGLVREATLMQTLRGIPNIPTCIGTRNNETEKTSYILMDYIEGVSLSEYVRSTPSGCLTEKEAVSLTKKIADAVGKLHANGICYRDLKPENIIISKVGSEPFIIDFGISGNMSKTDITPGGTKGYYDAYQMQRNEQTGKVLYPLTPQYDIFALGAVLAFMLTGIKPAQSTINVWSFDVFTPVNRKTTAPREVTFTVYQQVVDPKDGEKYFKSEGDPKYIQNSPHSPQTFHPRGGEQSRWDERQDEKYANKKLLSREIIKPTSCTNPDTGELEYYVRTIEKWEVYGLPEVLGAACTSMKTPHVDERADPPQKKDLIYREEGSQSNKKFEHTVEYYAVLEPQQPYLTGPHTVLNATHPNPAVSQGIEYVIGRATHPNLDERYKDISDLLVDLDQYELMGGEYAQKQGKRLLGVIGVLLLGIGSITGGIIAQQNENNQQNKMCSDLANKAKISANVDDYVAALDSCPTAKPDIYRGLIDSIASDGSFTKNEETQLVNVISSRKETLAKEEGYGALAFDIGKLYLLYYSTGKLDDGTLDKDGMVRSASWFKEAKDAGYDPDGAATAYGGIAEFQKTVNTRVQEGTDKTIFRAYWDDLQKIDRNLPATGKMTLYAARVDLINSYAHHLHSDGVPKEELERARTEIEAYIAENKPSGKKQEELYRYMVSQIPAMQDAIRTGYEG